MKEFENEKDVELEKKIKESHRKVTEEELKENYGRVGKQILDIVEKYKKIKNEKEEIEK